MLPMSLPQTSVKKVISINIIKLLKLNNLISVIGNKSKGLTYSATKSTPIINEDANDQAPGTPPLYSATDPAYEAPVDINTFDTEIVAPVQQDCELFI